MDTARYVFAVLLVVFLPPAIAWWFIVHPFIRFWRRAGPAVTYVFLFVFMAGSMYQIFVTRERWLGTDLGPSIVGFVAAMFLFTASVGVALERRKQLKFSTLAGAPELDASGTGGRLLDEGIYAKVRHPRYVEIVLGTLAYAAFANYTGAWIVAIATIPAIHLVVIFEERELRERFGEEYAEYSARVNRYWPKDGWRSAPVESRSPPARPESAPDGSQDP